MGIEGLTNKYLHQSPVKNVLALIKPLLFQLGVFDMYMKFKRKL